MPGPINTLDAAVLCYWGHVGYVLTHDMASPVILPINTASQRLSVRLLSCFVGDGHKLKSSPEYAGKHE
jgi:hypothetical protein